MIFVTVGTQLPFDRLIRAIDAWALAAGRRDVFAQIGPSAYRPLHFDSSPFLDAPAFRARVEECELLVAHAGMGSIITALELGKAILVMPRRASLNEHRNEHQLATAQRFLDLGRIAVAFDEVELVRRLSDIAALAPTEQISKHAPASLLNGLRAFVDNPAAGASNLDGTLGVAGKRLPGFDAR